jgi:hypothetical protein
MVAWITILTAKGGRTNVAIYSRFSIILKISPASAHLFVTIYTCMKNIMIHLGKDGSFILVMLQIIAEGRSEALRADFYAAMPNRFSMNCT